jgi:hypothetical protein
MGATAVIAPPKSSRVEEDMDHGHITGRVPSQPVTLLSNRVDIRVYIARR